VKSGPRTNHVDFGEDPSQDPRLLDADRINFKFIAVCGVREMVAPFSAMISAVRALIF